MKNDTPRTHSFGLQSINIGQALWFPSAPSYKVTW
jgi:hypothetical protein